MTLAPLVNATKAAKLCGLREDVFLDAVREGLLPRVQITKKIMRFDTADVEAFRLRINPPKWSERFQEPQPPSDALRQIDGFVYFLRCQNVVKIGFTTEADPNMPQRVKTMQTGNPYPLQLLLKIPGSRWHEKRIHQKLRRLCRQGEWFDLIGEVKEFLAALEGGAEMDSLL